MYAPACMCTFTCARMFIRVFVSVRCVRADCVSRYAKDKERTRNARMRAIAHICMRVCACVHVLVCAGCQCEIKRVEN